MRRTCYVSDWDKWVKKGRGQGDYSDYKPWFTIRDVPSHAVRTRLFSQRFQRVFTFLSHGELQTFLILEWNDEVDQIKEQYPLDPSLTVRIARELDIRHPAICGRDVVMTTDFVVEYLRKSGRRQTKAFQIKQSSADVENLRANEKLQIEQAYWQEKGCFWRLIYSSGYNGTKCSNLQWLFRWRNQPFDRSDLYWLHDVLIELIKQGRIDASNVSKPIIRLPKSGQVMSFYDAFYSLVAHKQIAFDVESQPVQTFAAQSMRLC